MGFQSEGDPEPVRLNEDPLPELSPEEEATAWTALGERLAEEARSRGGTARTEGWQIHLTAPTDGGVDITIKCLSQTSTMIEFWDVHLGGIWRGEDAEDTDDYIAQVTAIMDGAAELVIDYNADGEPISRGIHMPSSTSRSAYEGHDLDEPVDHTRVESIPSWSA